MYELAVTVRKVLGVCTADPPVELGDSFTVCAGNIRMASGHSVCMWALQSLLPVVLLKEREILEEKGQDWVWRVHHVQCPDPKGRVIFQIERVGRAKKWMQEVRERDDREGATESERVLSVGGTQGNLQNLRVVVEEVLGNCTSGMRPGDYFVLSGGRLYIPTPHHFCLYALHSVLPFLPAKQRPLEDGDWMKEESQIICPDPAGNVVMRIEPYP